MASDHFVHEEAATVNSDLQDLYYNQMTPATTVDTFREMLRSHDERCKNELIRRLGAGKSAGETESIQKEVADIFSVSAHVETHTQMSNRVKPAPARYRELIDRPDADGKAQGPRRGNHVYDVPIGDGLEAIVRDDPTVLSQWREAAKGWLPKKGESITVYRDITDGSFVQQHPELGVSADRSDGALRLGVILYYDEVEVVNAIGQFTGVHKIGLFYWGLLNYGPEARMNLSNIHLATVVLDADVSYYDVEQIVSGCARAAHARSHATTANSPPHSPMPCSVPNEPNWPAGSSIGASLRALHDGITLTEPVQGAEVSVLTRGWLVVVSADQPAAALLTGTMVGTSAQRFCRQCTVDRRTTGFDGPFSFLSETYSCQSSFDGTIDSPSDGLSFA